MCRIGYSQFEDSAKVVELDIGSPARAQPHVYFNVIPVYKRTNIDAENEILFSSNSAPLLRECKMMFCARALQFSVFVAWTRFRSRKLVPRNVSIFVDIFTFP